MHDPVVFFDKSGIDALLLGNDADQIGKLFVIVKIVSWHEAPPLLSTRWQKTSWFADFHNCVRRVRAVVNCTMRLFLPRARAPLVCFRQADPHYSRDRQAKIPW